MGPDVMGASQLPYFQCTLSLMLRSPYNLLVQNARFDKVRTMINTLSLGSIDN